MSPAPDAFVNHGEQTPARAEAFLDRKNKRSLGSDRTEGRREA